MSNNQPSSNRPQNHQSWQNNPHSSRPMAQRSHTLELTFLQAPAPGQTVVVSPVPGGVHVVAASTCDHGRGRGGGQGDGRGGGGGRGRGDGGQRRIDDMFPVANRIANARGDNSQGALNARSSRDGGDGRGRQSLDADAPRAAWDRRPQRNDNNGGRQSPSGWPDDRRGSPRGMDNDRPSHNRLDEATLSSDPARAARADVANETLKVLSDQAYRIPAGTGYDLRREIQNLARGTKFYSERDLTDWKPRSPIPLDSKTVIEFVEQSTIAAARLCGLQQRNHGKVGVLNFASATKRGGGFKNGAQAQEESLARASTLYLSLSQPDANRFYDTHIKMDHKGYYSHCMIYSPGVTIIRDENDVFVEPCDVNMVTSAAVNAGSVRRKSGRRHPQDVERDIYETMVERMGRILKCFEENGNKVLILGSFGTGVFQNDVGMVASIWAKLLGPGGRFSRSFDHVEFAILGRPTFDQFQKAYNDKINTQFARALSVAEAARP